MEFWSNTSLNPHGFFRATPRSCFKMVKSGHDQSLSMSMKGKSPETGFHHPTPSLLRLLLGLLHAWRLEPGLVWECALSLPAVQLKRKKSNKKKERKNMPLLISCSHYNTTANNIPTTFDELVSNKMLNRTRLSGLPRGQKTQSCQCSEPPRLRVNYQVDIVVQRWFVGETWWAEGEQKR